MERQHGRSNPGCRHDLHSFGCDAAILEQMGEEPGLGFVSGYFNRCGGSRAQDGGEVGGSAETDARQFGPVLVEALKGKCPALTIARCQPIGHLARERS